MPKNTTQVMRAPVPKEAIGNALQIVAEEIHRRIERKGNKTFAGRHEILGILAEEHHELLEAVWKGSLQDIRSELLDYIVGAIWGIACIDSGILNEDYLPIPVKETPANSSFPFPDPIFDAS